MLDLLLSLNLALNCVDQPLRQHRPESLEFVLQKQVQVAGPGGRISHDT